MSSGPGATKHGGSIPVLDGVLPGVDHVDVDVFVPARPSRVIAVAVPGGGMARTYFDLDLDGYSMARHLAAQGITVVTVDLPGVGTSPRPDDPSGLHPDMLAELLAAISARVVERAADGALVEGLAPMPSVRSVGLGHSMGAMLTVMAQGRRPVFDRLVLLGWSGRGLPEALSPDEAAFAGRADDLRREIGVLARARFGQDLPAAPRRPASSDRLIVSPIDREVRAALGRASAPMLTQAGLWAMIPGSHDREREAIGGPVLCGVGEYDITGEPGELPGWLPNAEVDVVVTEGAGHNTNVAPGRVALWDAVGAWCRTDRPGTAR